MRREAAGSGTSSARGCAERDLVGRENDSTDARGVARGWRRLGETHASVGARRCAAEEDPRNQCDARLIGAQRASASFFLFRFFLHVRALSTSAPRSVSVSLVFAWRLRGNGATAAIASLPKASPHARVHGSRQTHSRGHDATMMGMMGGPFRMPSLAESEAEKKKRVRALLMLR